MLDRTVLSAREGVYHVCPVLDRTVLSAREGVYHVCPVLDRTVLSAREGVYEESVQWPFSELPSLPQPKQ